MPAEAPVMSAVVTAKPGYHDSLMTGPMPRTVRTSTAERAQSPLDRRDRMAPSLWNILFPAQERQGGGERAPECVARSPAEDQDLEQRIANEPHQRVALSGSEQQLWQSVARDVSLGTEMD